MRFALIASLLVLFTLAHGQTFYTKAFAEQDFHAKEWKTIERFGKTEFQVVRMGHEAFVKWYCDQSRAGIEGRVLAEKVYGLALTECNAPLLLRLPRKEQKFMEDLISALADLAKSAFTTGIQCTNDGPGWSLPVAESSTAVSAVIYATLNPAVAVQDAPNAELELLLAQLNERVRSKRPAIQKEADRLKGLIEHLKDLVNHRSVRDQAIVRSFAMRMLGIALLTPPS
ncbi:MAG: hypothetical protein K1X67_05420 [Fimbriimonadaceae bacterium]|nr:hypothetical protein [Fimbriimonadaceae bacterium]